MLPLSIYYKSSKIEMLLYVLTAFLHHQRPHVPPAEVVGRLAAQALEQVHGRFLQVERALILQGGDKRKMGKSSRQDGDRAGRRTAGNLDGEDEHPATRHHVEEEDHGFVLVRRVGVECPLGHHVTLTDDRRTGTR